MPQSRIAETFNKLKKEGRKAFIPYIMAGHPSLLKTRQYVRLLEDCGADVIELGVPWTDPLADGPVIQAAAARAVKRGVGLREVVQTVGTLRKSTEIPIVLMTYYNPVFKYGVERFVRHATDAGVDGVIVPDLPPDEAAALKGPARRYGLDTIFLLAPTSTAARTRLVAKASSGFIYYVSITGITGARLAIGADVRKSIKALRSAASKPVCVGFGVSNAEDAGAVSKISDGVIVGSAIVKRISRGEDAKALGRFLRGLRAAIG